MPAVITILEQLAEFAPFVDQLVDVLITARKAFTHQRNQLLIQLGNQQDPLCRRIASAISKMDEHVKKEISGDQKEAYLRLHSMLTHLQIITETTCQLEETLQKQIKDGILFSDKAISEICNIFDQQTNILNNLADIMRNSGKGIQHRLLDECNNLSLSCLQYATEHETRLVEGLCFPQAAPLFLAILDQMQTIVHHEREITKLLTNSYFTIPSSN